MKMLQTYAPFLNSSSMIAKMIQKLRTFIYDTIFSLHNSKA